MIADINIHDLLPQQPPFVMVDKLIYVNSSTVKTALTVREDNIFCENGVLAEAGLIENIAQTCAARVANVKNEDMENAGVKIGFIGAIRNQSIERLPKVGETIVTQVNTLEEVFQMTLVNATVSIENEIIIKIKIK